MDYFQNTPSEIQILDATECLAWVSLRHKHVSETKYSCFSGEINLLWPFNMHLVQIMGLLLEKYGLI